MANDAMNVLTALAGTLVFTSLAAERGVEIVKGVWPWLNTPKDDPVSEGRRRSALHLLSAVAGGLIVWLAYGPISQSPGMEWMADAQNAPNRFLVILALGLLSTGGSSVWNSTLTYLLSVKDVKRAEASEKKDEVQQAASGTVNRLLPTGAITPPTRATAN